MLFDTSVRKELARSFGATLVVILTIVLTMMLIRTLGMAARGNVAAQDVVLVLLYTSLGNLPTLLTLSLFVAIVITLGRMYRDSEMAIWFSSGIGLMRFVRPVLRASWPVLLLVSLLTLLAWPWVNQQIAELKTQYEQRSDLSRVSPGSFQASADGSRVFFVERSGDLLGGSRNVFMLANAQNKEAVITARAGRMVREEGQQVLKLDSGQRNELDRQTGEHSRIRFEHLNLVIEPAQAKAAQALPAKAVDTLELLHEPDPKYQGELVWRLGLLLATLNIVLLGVATSASNPRRASNWNLLFALLAFVVYLNLVNLSQAWVSSGKVGWLPALLGLHGAAALLALGWIAWRDHASVLPAWASLRRGKAQPTSTQTPKPTAKQGASV